MLESGNFTLWLFLKKNCKHRRFSLQRTLFCEHGFNLLVTAFLRRVTAGVTESTLINLYTFLVQKRKRLFLREEKAFSIYKGDGRNVHVQTKGCMLSCDLFHTLTLSRPNMKYNILGFTFTKSSNIRRLTFLGSCA